MQLLRNADLYDPLPKGRASLLIGGERILWIGDELELPATLGVTVRDLEGRRVIPGLIDCHVHLTGGGGEAGMHTRVPPLQLSRLTGGGVTTAIGLLGTDDTVRSTAELVASARGLIAEGMSAWCYTGGYHLPPATLTGSVRADIAHIDLILGVGELAISDHRSSQPTLDELLRIAGDAHVGGLMTGKAGIVHLHVGDGERGLELVRRALGESELPPSVFNPTHVNRRKALFEEACDLAKARLRRGHHRIPGGGGRGRLVGAGSADPLPGVGASTQPSDGELGWRRVPPGIRCRRAGEPDGCGPSIGNGGGAAGAARVWPATRANNPRLHQQPGQPSAASPGRGISPPGPTPTWWCSTRKAPSAT